MSRFFEDAMKRVKSSSVGHAQLNIFDSKLSSWLNKLSQSSGAWVKSLNAEPFEVCELGSEEIDESLISGKPSQCGELLFLGEFGFFERFYLFLEFALEEISFLFAQKVHILKTNFIAIDIFEVILEGLNSIWSVIFLRAFFSQISDDDALVHLLFFVSELSSRERILWQSAM